MHIVEHLEIVAARLIRNIKIVDGARDIQI